MIGVSCYKLHKWKSVIPDEALLRPLLEQQTINVLFVGKLVSQRGYELLIEALKVYVDNYGSAIRLYFVDMDVDYLYRYKEELDTLIIGYGLEPFVFFDKNVTDERKAAYYLGCDFFLFASDYEGFYAQVIEAQFFGLPVISVGCEIDTDVYGDGQICVALDKKEIAAAISILRKKRDYYCFLQKKGFDNVNKKQFYESLNNKTEVIRKGSEKTRLLYVSPFGPQKSGISDYSERLVWGLKDAFEITILTKNKCLDSKSITDAFEILEYDAYSDYSRYDVILYNFGNSPYFHDYMYDMIQEYPGYVILHDFTLYYLSVSQFEKNNRKYSAIYQMAGKDKFLLLKEELKKTGEYNLLAHKGLAPELPLNNDILKAAKGIFVHSDYTKKMVEAAEPDQRVYRINIVDCMPDINLSDKGYLRKKYHWGDDDYIIGAVGFVAPSKQNTEAIEAVNQYNFCHEKKIRYVMIGEGEYADKYLSGYIKRTGFLKDQEFFEAVDSCDCIFNLRFPYNGESSASLMQCMLMGKECVVTDIGWFGELPDEIVHKIEDNSVDSILSIIEKLLMGDSKGQEAKRYVEENCNAKAVGKVITETIIGNMKSCDRKAELKVDVAGCK